MQPHFPFSCLLSAEIASELIGCEPFFFLSFFLFFFLLLCRRYNVTLRLACYIFKCYNAHTERKFVRRMYWWGHCHCHLRSGVASFPRQHSNLVSMMYSARALCHGLHLPCIWPCIRTRSKIHTSV